METITIYYKNSASNNNRLISFFIHDNLEKLVGAGLNFNFIEANGKDQRTLKKLGAEGLPCVKVDDDISTDMNGVIEYLKAKVNRVSRANPNVKRTDKERAKADEMIKKYQHNLLINRSDDDADEEDDGGQNAMKRSIVDKANAMETAHNKRHQQSKQKSIEAGKTSDPRFGITGGRKQANENQNNNSLSSCINGESAFDKALRKKMDGNTKSFKGKVEIPKTAYM